MISKLKSNKLISAFLIIMCIIILVKPKTYLNSSLNAISIWTFNILPLMFPFFVLTRIIADLNPPKQNLMDKYFYHAYHTPAGSFSTFMLSIMAGYPMGAKLVCLMYKNKHLNQQQAQKMLSFCSVSGPVFMIGTVGVIFLQNYKAGLIILISNILAALLNGFIYRGKTPPYIKSKIINTKSTNSLADYVNDSLQSVLLIAGYLILSFLLIDMLLNLNIIQMISNSICCVFNIPNRHDVVQSILCGLVEITRGIAMVSKINIPLKIKTILSSSVIAFGGFSVILQSLGFLKELKISVKLIILQKFTQTILCLTLTAILCLIFF